MRAALRETRWLVLLYSMIVLALLMLRMNSELWAVKLGLGTVGVCCGIGLAAAASTITQLYDEDKRASMLVITDGSFSVAGIAISSLAVLLVAKNLHWASSYLAVAGVAAIVVLLAVTA
ncbi:MAG: MFS transporter TsgA, partial [Acidobacteriota bacterium]